MANIKLVIKIPEEQYNTIKSLYNTFPAEMKEWGLEAIRNGIPLNDVLDKIRAEIETIIGKHNLDDYDFCSGLICARKIIDKYKAESEE